MRSQTLLARPFLCLFSKGEMHMFALAVSDATGALSIAAMLFLAACALVAVVGTRIVRSKQKQEVRRWRLERKPTENKKSK